MVKCLRCGQNEASDSLSTLCYPCDIEVLNGVIFNHKSSDHPLINKDSPHYQMVCGAESIELMEKLFTKEELMAWAKITSYKYRFRLGKKDSDTQDLHKMQTYEKYYKYLKETSSIMYADTK